MGDMECGSLTAALECGSLTPALESGTRCSALHTPGLFTRHPTSRRRFVGQALAEKETVIRIEPPPGERPRAYARRLAYDGTHEIYDKWGPAGCIRFPNGDWLLFGLAPD